MRKHNWHPKIVEDYLKKHFTNVDTRDTVRVYLKNFFEHIQQDPNRFLNKKEKDITDIIWKYAEDIEGRPKKTQSAMLSTLKKFLVRNDVNLKETLWEDLRIRNNLKRATRSITKKATPTQQDLKKILSYGDIRSRALFVFCASTGLRIDEALSLTWEDLDMDKRMITLLDDKAKFDIPRITFFTDEAKQLLELWKREREKKLVNIHRISKFYRDSLRKKGYEFKKENIRVKENTPPILRWRVYKDGKLLSKDEILSFEKRIFPFDYINAQRIWTNLLEKAGSPYNKRDTNPKLQHPRYLYNIHSLRRFWFLQLSSDRANPEYINFMGGHMSELDTSYKQFESPHMQKLLKEDYDKHMGSLMVFDVSPDISEIKDDMREKDQRIRELEETMHIMKMKMDILENKYELEKIKNGKK